MLINQMHSEFKLRGDSIDSQAFPDFVPMEIDAFLNLAINLVTKHTYKVDPLGSGFEVDEDKIEKLSTLHILSPEKQGAVTPSSLGNGVYEVNLSDSLDYSFWWVTKVDAVVTKENGGSKIIRCRPKKVDQLEDSFSRPSYFWKRCPIVIASSSDSINRSMYFYTDEDFTVSSARISYLKKPNRVWVGGYNHIDGESEIGDAAVSCDLPELVHDEIVNWALLEAFRSIGHPNIKLVESIIKEQFSK